MFWNSFESRMNGRYDTALSGLRKLREIAQGQVYKQGPQASLIIKLWTGKYLDQHFRGLVADVPKDLRELNQWIVGDVVALNLAIEHSIMDLLGALVGEVRRRPYSSNESFTHYRLILTKDLNQLMSGYIGVPITITIEHDRVKQETVSDGCETHDL